MALKLTEGQIIEKLDILSKNETVNEIDVN
jgi:hypothetical protein